MYLAPMMWTSVRPAGGGSVGAFCAEVSGAAAFELSGAPVVVLAGDVSAGVVEVDPFSTTGVDEASGGLDEVTVSTAGVVGAAESVDVAATCARTGLTTTNPMTIARVTAQVPTNVLMLDF